MGGAMAVLDVTQKTEVYETLSSLNMAFTAIVQHLQMLQKTGLFQSKAANCFRVLPKNCKPNSTKNFSKACTSLSWTIGAAMGKLDNGGKRNSATLTMYLFMPKNAKSSLPNNAREQPSRKILQNRKALSIPR
jgi:hypothetical protein